MAIDNGHDMDNEVMQDGQSGINAIDDAIHAPENIKKGIDNIKNMGDRLNQAKNALNGAGNAAKNGAGEAAKNGAKNAASQGAKSVASQGAKNAAAQGAQQAAAEVAKQAARTAVETAAASTGSGAAVGSAGGPIGAAIGAAAGLIVNELKKLGNGSSGAKWAAVGIILGLPVLSLLSWGNPRTTTNTVEGNNNEALQNDMIKDDNFLSSMGITADQINNDVALQYEVDDQYNQMATIIHDAVEAGYQKSLAEYPKGKANAKKNVANDHDHISTVYEYNGKYYDTVGNLWQKNKDLILGNEQELNGTEWDDGDYLNDNSNNGAMDSGTAYILAAYAVSRGNAAPVSGEDYTYYDGLKKLVNKEEAQLGYFEYEGSTVESDLTEKVTVKKVEQVSHYERKTTYNGNKYCSICSAGIDYESKGNNNSGAIGTKHTTSEYECDLCGATYGSKGDGKCSCGGSLTKHSCTYYECSKGHIFYTTNSDMQDKSPSSASSTNYSYASEYKVWEVVDTSSQNFDYTAYRYVGNISPFSYQDLLERMFLDDNDFYDDVQGVMYTGTYTGNAASITAGESITLPSGLGRYFTYMGWQMITSTTSTQYKLMQQSGMPFDSEGYGKINGRYVIACTTTFGQVGDYIDFYQSDGTVLQCIIGDIKNQNDAGCNQWGHKNGDVVVEFVVDKASWYGKKANPGTSSNHPEWGGKTIVKAVNGGSYFTNPDFVQSLGGKEPGEATTSTDSSDMQLKVANLAVASLQSNKSTQPATAGYCAAWVSGIYEAAGLPYPGGNAIDYWTKWKDSGSSDMTNIPVGAAVVGSGSSSPDGILYGHVGIYVGDTDGDGQGEVVDNIGRITKSTLSKWLSWQTTPCNPSYGGSYGPGFIGWVWPNGNALGTGMDYTGIDPSTLVTSQVNAGSLSRAQRLANIMASPYYEWVVYYEYECDHETATEATCPECGAAIKTKSKGFLWWKTEVPVFEYVKEEEPDNKSTYQCTENGVEKEYDPYSVSEKIDWYVDFILNSIDAAAQYETGGSYSTTGSFYAGAGNQSIVDFALSKVGNGGRESWDYYGFEDNWCAMFVSYCADSCGFIQSGIIPKYASCDSGMQWFKSKGLWQSRSSGYEPKPGDIIFYGTDSDSNHTGIVEKCEGGYVYTIEGNSGSSSTSPYFRGSKVTRHQYPLTKSNIVGYGTPEYPSGATLVGDGAAEQIYNFLISQGLTKAGAAGLMGNLAAESGLVSTRLQGDFSNGYTTSAAYTQQVDSGQIGREQFAKNGPNGGGYGLAQWTYYTRKYNLYDYAKSKNTSIGDLGMQLEFLLRELQSSYPSVLAVLKTSNDLTATTRKVLYDFENPAVKNLSDRLSLAKKYY